MPPYFAPVVIDTFAVKPPLFQDGPLRPRDQRTGPGQTLTVTMSGFGNPTGAFRAAYKESNNELFISSGNENDITVLDGFTDTDKRNFNINIPDDDIIADVAIDANGDLLVYTPNQFSGSTGKVYSVNPSTGALGSNFNISGDADTPARDGAMVVDPETGDILIYQASTVTGNFHVWRYSGDLSGTLISENDLPAVSLGGNLKGADIIDGNAFLVDNVSTNGVLLDGLETNSVLVDLSGQGISNPGAEGAAWIESLGIFVSVGYDGTNAIVYSSNMGDKGEAFVGNSGKTLEAGTMYTFEIVGPNAINDPTINDGGQGAKSIRLPGTGTVPVGAITGAQNFLFDGSDFVLQEPNNAYAEDQYFNFMRNPGESTDESSVFFGNRRTPNASRPVRVQAGILVRTDGTDRGQVRFRVDEDGDGNYEYDLTIRVPPENGSNAEVYEQFSVDIPAGGAYIIANDDDPNGGNDVRTIREIVQ